MRFEKRNKSAFHNFLLAKYARLAGYRKTPAYPYLLFIDPSSTCNLRCAMCVSETPNGLKRIRPPSIMSPELYGRILEEVGPYLFMISLYNWGEPFCNPDLANFIAKAKQHQIYVDINTNLSLPLADKQLADFLLSGVDNVVVSIDGFSQETYERYRRGGSFALAKGNVTKLASLRDQLGLKTEITWKFLTFSFNEHEAAMAAAYCKDIGIIFAKKDAIIDVSTHADWLPSHRQNEQSREYPGWPFSRSIESSVRLTGREDTCAWHYYYSAINSDGSVSPCCAVGGSDHDLGSLETTSSFLSLWNNDRFQAARAELATVAGGKTVCARCQHPFLKDLCTGIDQHIKENFADLVDDADTMAKEAFRLLDSGPQFVSFMEQNSNHFEMGLIGGDAGARNQEQMEKSCAVCGAVTNFVSKGENFSLRETSCPMCGSSRRTRDVARAIVESCGGGGRSLSESLKHLGHLAIYEAQASGPLHKVLSRLPHYVSSEYFDDVTPGQVSGSGVRCENLEHLSFADGTFDIVITQDIFEHIADPWLAFAEIRRVLKPGGSHILTVPLHEGRKTLPRVRHANGKNLFLFPPVYHGDPLRAAGSLVYTDFGDDLPLLLESIGFRTETSCKERFYEQIEIPFVDDADSFISYLTHRRRGEMLKFFHYNSVVFKAKRDDSLTVKMVNLLQEKAVMPADQWVSAGEQLVRAGDYQSARLLLEQGREQYPNDPELLNDLGVIAYGEGDFARAERILYQAIDSKANNWAARTNLADLYRHVPAMTVDGQEKRAQCPCCGGSFPSFISGGPSLRPNACCPRCGSLERHRLLWVYLQNKTRFFHDRLKVLHVAPESIYQDRFKVMPNLEYISADLSSPLAMIKMDITSIPFPDDSFDVIFCNHVLEHIPNDRKAMAELYRVLRPCGWAILQVPIDLSRELTYEDPSIIAPEERKKHFGQDDHVRWYGRDYPARLIAAGFNVTEDNLAGSLPQQEAASLGIVASETIYVGSKKKVKMPSADVSIASAAEQKIGAYWSTVQQHQKIAAPQKTRWWQSPLIIKSLNQLVHGKPVAGFSQGLIEKLKGVADTALPLNKGISIGCGDGTKEINLVRQGIVSSFDLFELSDARIEKGMRAAETLGLSGKVQFIKGNAFDCDIAGESYDLVHWNNALHHMPDVHRAVEWSKRVLKPGGYFFMDDFVGPSRFQWSDKMLQVASRIREALPEKYLRHPQVEGTLVGKEIGRPDPLLMAKIDPSEAADSERIIDAVQTHFPSADIRMTGGVSYNLALNDIINNFEEDDEYDASLLKLLMLIDELCAEIGENCYATALAVK